MIWSLSGLSEPRVPSDVVAAAARLAAAWSDPSRWNGPRFTRPEGVIYLGEGGTRVVFDVGGYAVKIPMSAEDGDREFNRQEAKVYRRAPAALKKLLLPVLLADPNGEWLIMPKAAKATEAQAQVLCRQVVRAAPWLTEDEVDCGYAPNAGVWNGKVYLLDYPVYLP